MFYLMEYVVEFEYAAQEPDELNLKVGEIITNVVKVQEGWCEGILNGKKGMFPDNFVKENKKPEKPKDLPQKRASAVSDIKSRLNSVITNPPPVFAVPAQKKTKKAKILYAYVAQNEDELNLEIGQIIEIIKQEEPGWYEGRLNGQTGVFPSNFVEVIETEDTPEIVDVPEIKGRKVIGVGFGPNIFNKEQIILKPTNRGLIPTSSDSKSNISNNVSNILSNNVITAPSSAQEQRKPVMSPSNLKDDIKPVLKAKALYTYKAENPDELNLNPGDVITVLDQNLEDAGWWKGECNGNVGVFPDNFVELLPIEEKSKKVLEPSSKPFPAVPAMKPKIKNEFKASIKTPQPCETGEPIKSEPVKMPIESKVLPKRPPVFAVNSKPAQMTQDPHKEDKPIAMAKHQQPPLQQQQSAFNKKEELHSLPITSPSHLQQPATKPQASSSPSAITVTSEMFDDLQKEVDHLKDMLDRMKKEHEKTLLALMEEIDEEKKTRYNMQVEMDRLRKLVSTSVINS